MEIIYRSPNTEKEFKEYYTFRWEQLRKPLGLKLGSEQDDLEKTAHHIAAFDVDQIIGIGRLQIENDFTARIRYMAVDITFRNQGIGTRLLEGLEEIAKTKNMKICWLHAREGAVSFYVKNKYEIKGEAESDLEIQHQRMEKSL